MHDFEKMDDPLVTEVASLFSTRQREADQRYFQAFVPAYKALSSYESTLLGTDETVRTSVQEYYVFIEHPTELAAAVRDRINAALETDKAFFLEYLKFMLKTQNTFHEQLSELFAEYGHDYTEEDRELFD
jgi:hypothetical protein